MENYEIDNRTTFQLFIHEHLDEIVRQIRLQFRNRRVFVKEDNTRKGKFYYTVKRIPVKDYTLDDAQAGNIYKIPKENGGGYYLCKETGEIPYKNIKYRLHSDFVYKGDDTFYKALITKSFNYIDATKKNINVFIPEHFFYELSETCLQYEIKKEDDALKEKLWDSAVTFMAILEKVSGDENFSGALSDMIDSMKCILGIASNPVRFGISLSHQYFSYILDVFGIVGSITEKNNTPKDSKDYAPLIDALNNNFLSNDKYLSKKEGADWNRELCDAFYDILLNHKVERNKEVHIQRLYHSEEIVPTTTYFIYDNILLVYYLKHVCGEPLKDQNELKEGFKQFYSPVHSPDDVKISDNAPDGKNTYYLRNFEIFKAYYYASKEKKYNVEIPDYHYLNYKIVPNGSADAGLVILPDQEFPIIAKTNDYVNRMVAMSPKLFTILEKQTSPIEDLRKQIECLLEETFNRKGDSAVLKEMISSLYKESDTNFEEQKAYYLSNVSPILLGIARDQRKSKILKCIGIGLVLSTLVGVIILLMMTFGGTQYELPKTILEEGNMAYERALNLENVIIKSNVEDNNSKGLFLLAKRCSVPVLMHEATRNYREAIGKYTRTIDDNSVEDTTKVELARRLARIYMFGKGGVFDPDLSLKYANLANEKGRYNQGLYLITYGLKNKFSDYVVCQIDQASLYGTIDTKDPYLPLMIQIREIETLNNGDDPDRENKIYDIVKNIKERKYDNPDVRHAALLYTLKLDANGLTDSLGNITYHRDLYNAVNTAEILSDELNSLGAQLWLGTTMEELRNPTAVNYYLLAAYNGSISGFYSALSYAEEQKEFMTAHPLLAKELGRNNDIGKLIWLRKYISDGKWTLADTCLAELKNGLSDKSLKLGNNVIPNVKKLITLHIPWKAKMLREKIDTAQLSTKCNFLNDVADSLRRSAALAYVDGMFYAEGLGDRQKDQIKADSLFRYAASLGMEDAAHTLGVRLINRHERREAEELLTPFFDSSDRMRILASQFYRLSDHERSQRYLSAVKDSLNLYKNIAAAYAYLDKPGRSTHNDSLMYHRILDSWDIMDGNPAWITGRVLFLLGQLSDNNPSRQDFYRELWISHFAQSTLISTGVDLPEEIRALLNDYYFSTGDVDPIYSFFALCNNKDKESAFNRLNQIGILNSALPDALAWLIEINKVTRNEVADTKSVLFTMPRILTNAPWHSVIYPYPTYIDLNTIFQLN